MNNDCFTISAKLVKNDRNIDGYIRITPQSICFFEKDKVVSDIQINWITLTWAFKKEERTRFLLFKSEYTTCTIRQQDTLLFKLIVEDINALNTVLQTYKTDFIEKKRHQEELVRQEAERKRQEELARLEAERKRQEELARLEAERKRQEELARQEAERKRQEELARQEAERKRQEELARQEAKRKRQEELGYQEQESVEESLDEDYLSSNDYYISLQNRVEESVSIGLSPIGERLARFLLEFFNDFLYSKAKRHPIDEFLYDEALVLFEEAGLSSGITHAFSTAMEYAFDYSQYEVAMLARIFDSVLDTLCGGKYFRAYGEEDDLYLTPKQISRLLDQGYTLTSSDDEDEVKSLNKCLIMARGHLDLAERRAAERDYLIREICQYIESQVAPVTKERLKAIFPKCTRTILQEVGSTSDILDYQDRYIAYKNIRMASSQTEEFIKQLQNFLINEENVCHVEQIYLNLRHLNQQFFSDGYIETSQQLYSYLSVHLRGNFVFEYPFIALQGTKIVSPESKLKEYVLSFEEISIDQILAYAKEHYVRSTAVLDLLVSLEDCMYIKNRERMISTTMVNLSAEDISDIEDLIYEELEDKDFCAIRELECITEFPYCDIPYDEWFIYSLLHRSGSFVNLQFTPGQFRYSLPVVSLYDDISKEDLQAIADRYAGQVNVITEHKVDNLDDLDTLIADEIDLSDIEDFEFLDSGDDDY